MGLTGLFLVSFLFVHVSGNILLFKSDGGLAFNEYTRFMTTTSIIKILEWVLFGGFIAHIILAAVLTSNNNKARPEKYAFNKSQAASSNWFSRNMGLSGTIVLTFLILHLVMFWGKYKFGDGTQEITLTQAYEEAWKLKEPVLDSNGAMVLDKNSYVDYEVLGELRAMDLPKEKYSAISMTEVVKASFSADRWYIVVFYVLALVLLAFHLSHGFQSAFRTLGFVHKKYTPAIMNIGTVIAVGVPIVFAAMPLFFLFRDLGLF